MFKEKGSSFARGSGHSEMNTVGKIKPVQLLNTRVLIKRYRVKALLGQHISLCINLTGLTLPADY